MEEYLATHKLVRVLCVSFLIIKRDVSKFKEGIAGSHKASITLYFYTVLYTGTKVDIFIAGFFPCVH